MAKTVIGRSLGGINSMRRHGDISSDGCTEGPHADQVSVPESINGKIHALNAAFQGAFELRKTSSPQVSDLKL